ncbi:MAG: glutamine synthetase III [Spirochaetales bacterium]|nr:glutamine synthetase III [Spirochaetales bacterium]
MDSKRFEITELFGSNVFNYKTMRERMPKETFNALMNTIQRGVPLSAAASDVVANAMKDWAIEKGATHYTHWFQPLTGKTAEKHDSFISPTRDGGVIMEFSGKQLIQGEPDASSFPSGGLRATFEARGYTAWDCTSPAFLKQDALGNVTLCIPTAFCSFRGEALDTKTPLLRSMKAVETRALELIRILGNTTSARVISEAGVEQEYFLVDKKYFLRRLDLMLAGRTLFGAQPPKGQELDDQYSGAIKDRVSDFMRDLDIELWKMGIASKTKHNEVAPSQFELAPIYTSINIAADQNQLIMETMQKVALRHELVCLLHEKPFRGVNGSGKHINWGLSTDDGINLLDPGNTPHENEQFLLFLSALIRSVDKYQGLLRASTANPGNEHRLGAHEAPPAIISIFLGDELTDILLKLGKGEKAVRKEADLITIGVDTLPPLPKDNTDRNRTSPFAFTGNKFEFRMVPSSASISEPNMVINTIVAETLDLMIGRLKKAKDRNKEATLLIREIISNHNRIIYNGNNYSKEWEKEAGERGLENVTSSVEALKAFASEEALDLFEKFGVLTREESVSRYEVHLDLYAKQINIEARISLDMLRRQYIPAAVRYITELARSVSAVEDAAEGGGVQKEILKQVSSRLESAYKTGKTLAAEAKNAACKPAVAGKAAAYSERVLTSIGELRKDIDGLETLIPADIWPVPTYAEMMFHIE